MNSIKMLLLYPLIVGFQLHSMEQSLSLSVDQNDNNYKSSRVQSLKQMILSKLATHFVENNDAQLLNGLKRLVPESVADCARTLAEDQRVLLWNIFGMTKDIQRDDVVLLDHEALIDGDLAENGRENMVYAASFTSDGQYLITSTIRRAQEIHSMLYVWSVADIKKHEKLKSDLSGQVASPENKAGQVSPVKPCCEFILAKSKKGAFVTLYNNTILSCPSDNSIIATVDNDCYFLKLEGGLLRRIWRLNILCPQANIVGLREDSETELALYGRAFFAQYSFAPYIKSISLNSTGSALLLLIKRNYHPDDKNAPKHDPGTLYCLSLDNEAHFAPYPFINGLDDAVVIAENVLSAVWHPDKRIITMDVKKKNLHVFTTKGVELTKKELGFPSGKPKKLRPFDLQFIPSTNKLLLYSIYKSPEHSYERCIHECNIGTGDCALICDADNRTSLPASNPESIFMPDGRFALKLFQGDCKGLYLALWDTHLNSYAKIINWWACGDIVLALSPSGNHAFISAEKPAQGRSPDSSFSPSILSLQTPYTDLITLEELIVLAKRNIFGATCILQNPEYATTYNTIGSGAFKEALQNAKVTPSDAQLKEALIKNGLLNPVHRYFNERII